jgi:hypothetical protein
MSELLELAAARNIEEAEDAESKLDVALMLEVPRPHLRCGDDRGCVRVRRPTTRRVLPSRQSDRARRRWRRRSTHLSHANSHLARHLLTMRTQQVRVCYCVLC